jgi:hypothetical protein
MRDEETNTILEQPSEKLDRQHPAVMNLILSAELQSICTLSSLSNVKLYTRVRPPPPPPLPGPFPRTPSTHLACFPLLQSKS